MDGGGVQNRDCEIVVCCVDADAATGERLTHYLREQLGYVVAFYKEMPTGAHWTSVIRRQFDRALATVILHSKNSVGHAYLEDEVIRARTKGTYFPVLLDDLAPSEQLPGDLVIQSIRLDRNCAPSGQVKVKFDNDLDDLVVQNGPEAFQRMLFRLSYALEKERKLRKLAEEKAIQAALSTEDEAQRLVREASDLQVVRALELCESLLGMLRRLLDLLEKTTAQADAFDDAIDEVASDAVTKLARIAEQTVGAEASAARQELRLRISDAVKEIDRLQRLRSARRAV